MSKDTDVDLSEDRAFFFRVGSGGLGALLYKGVCAPKSWTPEQVEAEATRRDPPGTSANRWEVTEVNPDIGLDHNPCQCNDDPTRHHWVLNC